MCTAGFCIRALTDLLYNIGITKFFEARNPYDTPELGIKIQCSVMSRYMYIRDHVLIADRNKENLDASMNDRCCFCCFQPWKLK